MARLTRKPSNSLPNFRKKNLKIFYEGLTSTMKSNNEAFHGCQPSCCRRQQQHNQYMQTFSMEFLEFLAHTSSGGGNKECEHDPNFWISSRQQFMHIDTLSPDTCSKPSSRQHTTAATLSNRNN